MTTPPAAAALSDREQWRRDYRRRRTQRSTLVAATSTVAFAVVLWLGVTHAPGWSQFHRTFLSWSEAEADGPDVLRGLWLNVRILVVGEVLILALGLLVAAVRTLQGAVLFPLRALATLYTDFFRGMPLIVLLYLVGFGLPSLQLSWVPSSPTVLGTAAIVVVYSAYVAEVFRAGIQSVHPSQRAAARSLGLTQAQTLRLVVFPQALRTVIPPLLNDFVAVQKDVGLVSIVGAVDAVRAAQIHQTTDFNYTPYVLAGLLFVLLAVPCARLADALGARTDARQRAGAVV